MYSDLKAVSDVPKQFSLNLGNYAAECFVSEKYHCEYEMVKFNKRIVAKIFIFQIVNFDYFLVKNDYPLVT